NWAGVRNICNRNVKIKVPIPVTKSRGRIDVYAQVRARNLSRCRAIGVGAAGTSWESDGWKRKAGQAPSYANIFLGMIWPVTFAYAECELGNEERFYGVTY
ncbi:MAG: hypothetical protein MK135_16080, partial [Polyangiaceae bacterium]|nr:hypothetical protein [Polyangiaceae bacterium]